jgi:hypothetical protein
MCVFPKDMHYIIVPGFWNTSNLITGNNVLQPLVSSGEGSPVKFKLQQHKNIPVEVGTGTVIHIIPVIFHSEILITIVASIIFKLVKSL